MNGLAPKHYVTDCPLKNCHEASTPVATKEAAVEWRRKHLLRAHGAAVLVDHIAGMSSEPVEFEPTKAVGVGQ